MDNQQATQAELGWLAGIIDGEGWIGFTVTYDHRGEGKSNRNKRTVKTEIKVVNCDKAIIERTADIFRKLGVNPFLRQARTTTRQRAVYECACKHMTGTEKILQPILEHLTGNKQERAILLLRFIDLRRSNPGNPNPAYADGAGGRKGPRTLKAYSDEEMQIVEACRALQAWGASETTREDRDRSIRALKRSNDRYLSTEIAPDKI